VVGIGGNSPEVSLRAIRSFEELLPNEIQGSGSTRKGMTGLVGNRIGISCLDSSVSSIV
jgi:hypothetical protein